MLGANRVNKTLFILGLLWLYYQYRPIFYAQNDARLTQVSSSRPILITRASQKRYKQPEEQVVWAIS